QQYRAGFELHRFGVQPKADVPAKEFCKAAVERLLLNERGLSRFHTPIPADSFLKSKQRCTDKISPTKILFLRIIAFLPANGSLFRSRTEPVLGGAPDGTSDQL
ncbi:hypothetical protein ANANG_G00257570, partial [Anguilla anguilla]